MRELIEQKIHEQKVALMHFLSGVAARLNVGKHVYVVGGAVRDFALGLPIKDIDVVIDSKALRGKDSAWFAKEVQKSIPAKSRLVTNKYGVAILTVSGPWQIDGHSLDGEVIEIANAREESYGGEEGQNYKPTQVNAAGIDQDVYRREFTFNTLMWRLSDLENGPDKAEIVDITGCGLDDLKAGEMRCPSDPDKTFRDDPTRMLRAIKFLVRHDWKIAPEVRDSIRRNASMLRRVPYEAIAKLLAGDILKEETYKKALSEMADLGLLDVIVGMFSERPQFALAMRNWASEQRVKVLFDMMDMGFPVGSRIGFLSKEQQGTLRVLAVSMSPEDTDHLIAVLRQPGKAMDTKLLMRELHIEGRAVGQLADIAREILLRNPSLMHDEGGLTAEVLKAARSKGIKEEVTTRAILAILEEKGARCASCGGPFHEATGWVLQAEPFVGLCGRCAKDFAAWYKGRMTMMSIIPSKQKALAKKLGMEPESFAAAIQKSIKP